MNDNYVYIKSHEQHVKAILLYADENKVLYRDKALTVGVTKSELKEAFLLGAFVVLNADDAKYLDIAVSLSESEGGSRYEILTANNITFYSMEETIDDEKLLAVGETIKAIGFNSSVSIDEMTNYLSSLTYDYPVAGVDSACRLMCVDYEDDYIGVWAINFNAFAELYGTSGYGIAIVDDTGIGWILLQDVFASEYSEANKALCEQIKASDYELNYTKSGWSNTTDYVLTDDTEHTIAYVRDNFVSKFVINK